MPTSPGLRDNTDDEDEPAKIAAPGSAIVKDDGKIPSVDDEADEEETKTEDELT